VIKYKTNPAELAADWLDLSLSITEDERGVIWASGYRGHGPAGNDTKKAISQSGGRKVTKGSVRVQFGRQLRTGSALALVTLFAGATFAAAQTAPAQTNSTATDDAATVSTRNKAGGESTVVIITGSRTSQRSSIDRKKKAKTATDSIVAEDIGAFPDKNVDEAISRVAGISLDRGDNGEGQGFSIRGQGPEQTHVDVDGMSVLNTNGALANGAQAGTGGRGADLRELPAEMVKSIDVVKGSTAAMTEGSLGGSVHIETRTGLDFKKPFFQISGGEQMDSTTKKWTPEWNAIFARKFFGGRFGIVGNVNYEEIQTTSDIEQPQTSGNAGPFRNADFDQSPNKTFSFATAPIDPTQTAPNVTVPGYSSLSPVQIVQESGAATTQQQCQADFPSLTTAQLNAITTATAKAGGNSSAQQTNRQTAITEQTNELQTCLNQWNDYAPSLIRLLPRQAYERRLAIELRGDYRVNDDLTLYAIGNIANRTVQNTDITLNLGSPAYNQTGSFDNIATFSSTSTSNALNTPRTVATGLGYGFYSDDLCATTVSGTGTAQTTTGCGTESDMSNVVVDKTHHVTSFTLNDATANTDAISYHTLITSWNAQVGGHYHHDNVKLDFMYGDSGSTWQQAQLRTAVSAPYGSVNVSLTPSGLWTYNLPSNLNIASLPFSAVNPAVAEKAGGASNVQAAVPAYTAAQAAQWGSNFTLTWRPRMSDDHEKQLKWDLTYDFQDKIPFIQDVQFGMQDRDHIGNAWSGGGYTVKAGTGNVGDANYVAPVVVPTENLTVNYRSCMPTATSTQPCNYGYLPGTTVGTDNNAVANLNDTLFGTMTYTPTDLAALINKALYPKPYPFLGDYPDKGNVLTTWPLINPNAIAAGIPQQVFDLSCMKVCKANDGNTYAQPHFAYHEKTDAMYFMFDFEQKLPWGMVFNGNAGERYIKTDVNATGFMTLAHTSVVAGYDPVTNPNAVATTSVALNTSMVSHTVDWTPSYNLNLWVVPDKVVLRYYSGHVISRPNPGALLPSGTCTVDDRNNAEINDTLSSDATNGCSGRVGNPALKPYKAINHNESIEWYPNKDDEFSLTYYYNNVLVGAPITANLSAANIFAGNPAAVDPVTGKPFSAYNFNLPSYVNGPSGLQRGVEFASKMAFTFLPWFFKYTGTDFNYSKLGYKNSQTSQDLISGSFNPPQGQRSWTENWSLWYDDGRLNARVTYQGQSAYFDFISSCSNAINNQPTSFAQCPGQTIRTPYNPGGSNWRAMTRFIDAKINYKLNRQLEFYVQGRNITRAPTYREVQPNNPYADGTPMLEAFSYGGARWEAGFTWRN
jgi:TonB-dependent receptor